jgi:hypothetical protein
MSYVPGSGTKTNTFTAWSLVESCSDVVFTYTAFLNPPSDLALPADLMTFNPAIRRFTINTSNLSYLPF